jgi:hypothetical protein
MEDYGFSKTSGAIASAQCKPKTWREFFKTVPQFNQRQDSTQEQLQDLYHVANKLGFYDAADFLKSHI